VIDPGASFDVETVSPLTMVNIINRTYPLAGVKYPSGKLVSAFGESGRIPLDMLADALNAACLGRGQRLAELTYYDEPFNIYAYLDHQHPRWYLMRVVARVPGLSALVGARPALSAKISRAS
jgi:hypothetical protein